MPAAGGKKSSFSTNYYRKSMTPPFLWSPPLSEMAPFIEENFTPPFKIYRKMADPHPK